MPNQQTEDYLNNPETGCICAACRQTFNSDQISKFYPESQPDKSARLELCEDCAEDYHREFAVALTDDVLPDDRFNKLATWARWYRFMNEITMVDEVCDFFAELSKDMAWHPDTEFQEYQDSEGKRTFDDKLAIMLNQRMGDCFDICAVHSPDKIYALALEISQPELFAKGEALELLVKAYNAVNELQDSKLAQLAWANYPAMLEWKVMTKKLLEREGRL